MDVLSPDLGSLIAKAKGKKGGKGRFWSWKKFAALLDTAGKNKAKFAGKMGQPTSAKTAVAGAFTEKTNDQLRLTQALLDRAKKPDAAGSWITRAKGKIATESLTQRLTQLMGTEAPAKQIPVVTIGDGLQQSEKTTATTKGKGKKAGNNGIEAMLQILSIQLDSPTKKAETQTKKATKGNALEGGLLAESKSRRKGTAKKSTAGVMDPNQALKPDNTTRGAAQTLATLGRAMGGEWQQFTGSTMKEDNPAIKELAAAMGLQEGQGLGKGGRRKASLLQFHSQVAGQQEAVAVSTKKTSRGQKNQTTTETAKEGSLAEGIAKKGAARRQQLSMAGPSKVATGPSKVETVKVDQSWESLIRSIAPERTQRGDKPETRPVMDHEWQTVFNNLGESSNNASPPKQGYTGSSLERALEDAVIRAGRKVQHESAGDSPLKGRAARANQAAQANQAAPKQAQGPQMPGEVSTPELGHMETPDGMELFSQREPAASSTTKTQMGPEQVRRDTTATKDVSASQMAPEAKGPQAPTDVKPGAAPPRPPQPMFSQVEAGIRHAYIVRPKAVTVRLSPEEMGEIQVQVSHDNDKIKAKIQAESQKVVGILKDHQAELENRLQEQGVELDQLDIRQDEQANDSNEKNGSGSAQGEAGQHRRSHSDGAHGAASDQEGDGEAEGAAESNGESESIYDENGHLSVTA